MFEDKISVVIPVYNVAPYLQKCIESVRKQTYTNLEIILINDGSTDESGAICDKYKLLDDRIIVIHQKNAGQAVARNKGIDRASGEWIAFLDSDDWIEPEMYQSLIDIAISNEADISCCLSRNCTLVNVPEVNDNGNIIIYNSDDMIRGLFLSKIKFEVWDKIWKRDLISDVRFIKAQIGEEVYFDRILFLRAKKMACIQRTYHNYLCSRPGNTNASFKQARLCIFRELDYLAMDMKKRKRYDIANMVMCCSMDFAVDMYVNAYQAKQDKKVLNEIEKSFENNYKQCRNKCEGRHFKKKRLAYIFHWNRLLCTWIILLKRKVNNIAISKGSIL